MNPIDAVNARLDGGRLWKKNDLGDTDGEGPCCLIGAAISVNVWDVLTVGQILRDVICAQFADRIPEPLFAISDFNNHPDTTWPEMEMVLEKAAVLWDEANA